MKWHIEKSKELKLRIVSDKKLLKRLSEKLEEIFKDHGVELGNKGYIFEPRVFTMEDTKISEMAVKSREAMGVALLADLYQKGAGQQHRIHSIGAIMDFCPPQCGGLDPFHLRLIEEFRMTELTLKGEILDGDDLMKHVMGKKQLLQDVSQAVFSILSEHGINFGKGEGCVFTPFVFDKPIYAQQIAETADFGAFRGFGPRVYTLGVTQLRPQPIPPGFIELQTDDEPILIPSVIVDDIWWTGIPDPELLYGLDVMR